MSGTSKTGYRGGVLFDYAAGDFVRDGGLRLLSSDGIEAWKSWCINCMLTERYRHRAYSTDFGIELDEAFRAETREKAESLLTRQIVEALEADPYGRTDYVSEVRFDWTAPDSVQVCVTVRGVDDVTIDITANLNR